MRVVTVDTAAPSPFASSLLFGFVANYIYDGDAPLAERRAQALSIDQGQLRELLGDAELRELLDADVLAAVEAELQQLEPRFRARGTDGIHDLLLRVGDLSPGGASAPAAPARWWRPASTTSSRRAGRCSLPVAGMQRFVATEDAARYRDALGVPLPAGLPEALLVPVRDPLGDLVSRHARTHAPFTTEEAATRLGLPVARVEPVLEALVRRGRVVEGAFRPGGTRREWCDVDVLAVVRRRSLARARHAVEPVEPRVLGRFLVHWHGIARPRPGLDAVLDVVERLQGCALPASVLESEILPARVERYAPGRPGHARGRGGGRVGGRRAHRRARRPHRAVPDGSPSAPAAPTRAAARRGAAHRARPGRPRGAADEGGELLLPAARGGWRRVCRGRRWRRSGTWCGRAW